MKLWRERERVNIKRLNREVTKKSQTWTQSESESGKDNKRLSEKERNGDRRKEKR